MDVKYIFVTIAVIAAVTALLRFLPFIVFGEKRQVPRVISYLGKQSGNVIKIDASLAHKGVQILFAVIIVQMNAFYSLSKAVDHSLKAL